jgi:HSP20 family protein
MMSRYRGRGFYDPLSEMNRLFGEMFGGFGRRAGTAQQGTPVAAWAPSIDVLQRDGDLVIRAELPGAKPEDVDITVQNGLLTISGRIEEEREEERRGYLVRERRYGTFRRSLQLPQDVDESDINARFQDGVLEVTIPGAAAVQEPRRIQVEGADGSDGGRGTEGPSSVGPPRTEEAPPRTEEGRAGARRQPEGERKEDEGLLDRVKETILGEEEESRRREGTDRPEDRR